MTNTHLSQTPAVALQANTKANCSKVNQDGPGCPSPWFCSAPDVRRDFDHYSSMPHHNKQQPQGKSESSAFAPFSKAQHGTDGSQEIPAPVFLISSSETRIPAVQVAPICPATSLSVHHSSFAQLGDPNEEEVAPTVPLQAQLSPQPIPQGLAPCNIPQFSFAQLVDPNEGTELKYIPSKLVNGTSCTQLEKSDVIDEIQYW
ncbi:hypothetical protein Cgig2_022176 [Carnegiea gigantea]|uniref:Uncharacterized protein n=1 Tax=Carnegiea gigantea TaxID=171969 RepID=A0A9Q1JGP6_9CARY|nr:hypothetical protein Cgig2_022176 [Carnegiea gigantea]